VAGSLTGLTVGDHVQFRWRFGSMNTSLYSISTVGGYGLDNVSITNVAIKGCDTSINPDVGCAAMTPPAPPLADGVTGTGIRIDVGAGADELDVTLDTATCSADHAVMLYGSIGDFTTYQGSVDLGCALGAGPNATVTHAGDNVWFNIIWVNEDDAAGSPGFGSSGQRSWSADGFCGIVSEDTSDSVCD